MKETSLQLKEKNTIVPFEKPWKIKLREIKKEKFPVFVS